MPIGTLSSLPSVLRMPLPPTSRNQVTIVIVLGIVLLIAGFVLKISILWTIGIILIVIGVVLALLGSMGRAVGGRRHYY